MDMCIYWTYWTKDAENGEQAGRPQRRFVHVVKEDTQIGEEEGARGSVRRRQMVSKESSQKKKKNEKEV